jgi:transposase-like protein
MAATRSSCSLVIVRALLASGVRGTSSSRAESLHCATSSPYLRRLAQPVRTCPDIPGQIPTITDTTGEYGVTTRKVASITEELCGREFANATISDLCKRRDPLVDAWNERDLNRHRYPFVLVDGLVIKAREGSHVVARSALIAVGVNEDGFREILGLRLGDSESERTWMDFFTWLKGRGLGGADLVVSDHHGGLVNAIRLQFQGGTWQRCQTRLSAHVSDAAPKALRDDVHGRVTAVFTAPDMETARALLAKILTDYEASAPSAVAMLERGFDDASAVLALPAPYRRRLRTTNGVERLNEELRRRERVIRIFPNRQSAIRLFGALLLEQDEQWSTGKRYFDMSVYWQWRDLTDSLEQSLALRAEASP